MVPVLTIIAECDGLLEKVVRATIIQLSKVVRWVLVWDVMMSVCSIKIYRGKKGFSLVLYISA